MNQPEDFGFVQDVQGVGAATIIIVKVDGTFDDGHLHHSIPFESNTHTVFGQDFEVKKWNEWK